MNSPKCKILMIFALSCVELNSSFKRTANKQLKKKKKNPNPFQVKNSIELYQSNEKT